MEHNASANPGGIQNFLACLDESEDIMSINLVIDCMKKQRRLDGLQRDVSGISLRMAKTLPHRHMRIVIDHQCSRHAGRLSTTLQ